MATTIRIQPKLTDKVTGYRFWLVEIDGPASYSTGGFAFDITTYTSETAYVVVQAEEGYGAEYDSGNDKIKSYDSAGSETGAATNLSDIKFFVQIWEA